MPSTGMYAGIRREQSEVVMKTRVSHVLLHLANTCLHLHVSSLGYFSCAVHVKEAMSSVLCPLRLF